MNRLSAAEGCSKRAQEMPSGAKRVCKRTNSKLPRSCFVSGHGFSRAAMVGSDEGFSPLGYVFPL